MPYSLLKIKASFQRNYSELLQKFQITLFIQNWCKPTCLLFLWHNNRCRARPACTTNGLGLQWLIDFHSCIVSRTYMSKVNSRLEPMMGMLFSCTSCRLYHEPYLHLLASSIFMWYFGVGKDIQVPIKFGSQYRIDLKSLKKNLHTIFTIFFIVTVHVIDVYERSCWSLKIHHSKFAMFFLFFLR